VPKEYQDDEAVFNDVGGGSVTVPFPEDDRLFDAAMELVFQSEGGYVNHPNDPGGPTNMGITFDTAKRHGYRTITALKNMTREQAKEIYRMLTIGSQSKLGGCRQVSATRCLISRSTRANGGRSQLFKKFSAALRWTARWGLKLSGLFMLLTC
jgi:hypothetical protein